MPDFVNFLQVQTQTRWAKNLASFAGSCAPAPNAMVLDVGCGPGLLPAMFRKRGCQSMGVDTDRTLLATRLTATLAQADVYRLPFMARSFDLVTATNVIFLLAEPIRALKECRRVLKANGILCMLNPSEALSVSMATKLAEEQQLEGVARGSLLGWAENAEKYGRWSELETGQILRAAGLVLEQSILRVGPGFARFSRARNSG